MVLDRYVSHRLHRHGLSNLAVGIGMPAHRNDSLNDGEMKKPLVPNISSLLIKISLTVRPAPPAAAARRPSLLHPRDCGLRERRRSGSGRDGIAGIVVRHLSILGASFILHTWRSESEADDMDAIVRDRSGRMQFSVRETVSWL